MKAGQFNHLRRRERTRESGYESVSQMYRYKRTGRTGRTLTGVNGHKWLRANDEASISWLGAAVSSVTVIKHICWTLDKK